MKVICIAKRSFPEETFSAQLYTIEKFPTFVHEALGCSVAFVGVREVSKEGKGVLQLLKNICDIFQSETVSPSPP